MKLQEVKKYSLFEKTDYIYFKKILLIFDSYSFLIYFFISFCFILILFFLSYFLSSSYNLYFDSSKLKTYECGFTPIKYNLNEVFKIEYVHVALIFLLFDLEFLYIFPLIPILKFFIYQNFFCLFFSSFFLFFILILSILYEYCMRFILLNNAIL